MIETDEITSRRRRPLATALVAGLMLATAGGLSACGEDSEEQASEAMEETGEAMEQAAEEAKETMEEAGDAVEEATDEAAE